jgi:hypothetical protein
MRRWCCNTVSWVGAGCGRLRIVSRQLQLQLQLMYENDGTGHEKNTGGTTGSGIRIGRTAGRRAHICTFDMCRISLEYDFFCFRYPGNWIQRLEGKDIYQFWHGTAAFSLITIIIIITITITNHTLSNQPSPDFDRKVR